MCEASLLRRLFERIDRLYVRNPEGGPALRPVAARVLPEIWEDDAIRNRYPECGDISTVKQSAPDDYAGGVSDILLFFKTYAYSGN